MGVPRRALSGAHPHTHSHVSEKSEEESVRCTEPPLSLSPHLAFLPPPTLFSPYSRDNGDGKARR